MSLKEKREVLQQAILEDYLQAEHNLSYFFKAAWDVLEPEYELLWNWHHDLMSEYLMACHLGQIKRLIINIPPRTTKSLLCTITFPVWIWLQNPRKRFLFGSYAEILARKHSLLRRNLIESIWFQSFWSNKFKLSEDQNVKTNFTNNKTGHMISAGILGSVLGEGCDYLIIDDPHNPKKAESDAERTATLMAFDQSWSTRLNDKKNGNIIVVMQRLHEQDLTGHLLEKNAGYVHLKVPQICEQKTVYSFPISGKIITRNAGQLMHPERDGQKEIDQIKLDLGSYGFAGQQQQEPSPAGGGLIKRKWWKFYKELPAKLEIQIISMDPTAKDTSKSDYAVAQCWGKVGANKYFIDQIRDRMDFVTSVKALTAFCAKHPEAHTKIIEDKVNGPAIINTLKNKISGLIPFNPKTSKEQRVAAVSPQIEAGNVYLPDPSIAPWINDFIEECSKFPFGAHDDQVDAAVQALLRLSEQTSGKFLDHMEHSREIKDDDIIGGGDSW